MSMRLSIMRFLLFALLLSVKTSLFAGDKDFVVDGIRYQITSTSTVEVIHLDYWNNYSGDIVIPDFIEYNETTYSVTSISSGAFRSCTNLTSVTVGDNVITIESMAFSGCSKLTTVILGKGVKTIGDAAFELCSSLPTITIPNSVTSIGGGAFHYCYALVSITIPYGITKIDDYTFNSCTSLTSISIPNSVTYIGDDSFSYCSSLASIELPNSITRFGGTPFWGSGLETVIISSNFSSEIFRECKKLREITLGENVSEIDIMGDIADKIKKITCLAQNPPRIEGSWEIDTLEVPYGNSLKYANAKIWNSSKIIYSKKDGEKYYPIIILATGGTVASINNTDGFEAKEGEFVELKSFGTLTNHPLIMKGTQNISHILLNQGSFTFVPSENHSDNIFSTYDFPLIDVTLSESGTLMDKVNIDDILNIENLKISGDINGTDLLIIRKMENLKLLDLKDAHIVNGGMSYFQKYVTSKNKIGEYFFYNNRKLYTVILPQDITEICNNSFDDNIITISIPKSVRIISESCIGNNGSVHIEDMAAYCTMRFGVTVWPLWRYCNHDLYLNDKKVTDIIIPDDIEEISYYAFQNVNGIQSVIIPKSVTKIGEGAFYCHIDKSVTCLNPIPPEINGGLFREQVYNDAILYVPKGSKTLYWLHPYWENFKNIVELDDSGVNGITIDPSPKSKGVYAINGVKLSADADIIENLPKGIYIINGEKVVIK